MRSQKNTARSQLARPMSTTNATLSRSGRRSARVVMGMAIAAALGSSVAEAAVVYWDTNGTVTGSGNADGTWSTSNANWGDTTGTTSPAAWVNGDTAVFAAGTDFTGTRTVTVSGAVTLGGLTINSPLTNLTITGSTLDFGAATGSINTSAWGTTAGKVLYVSSALAGSAGLTIASHGDLSDGGGSNSSFLQLGANNSTLTGGITITSGLVDHTTASAFGANTLTLNGGGILNANHGSIALTNSIIVGASGAYVRDYGSATSTLSGYLSGAGLLTKTDSGTVIVSGSTNALTGSLRVGGGAFILNGTGVLNSTGTYAGNLTLVSGTTFSYATAASQTLTGTISNAGTMSVSAGSLTLAGTTSGAGATSLSGGLLTLDYTTSNSNKLGTGLLTWTGGNLSLLGNSGANSGQTLTTGNLTISSATQTLLLATQTGRTLTFDATAGTVTRNAGAFLNITTTGAGATLIRLGGLNQNTAYPWILVNGDSFGKTDGSDYLTGSTTSATSNLTSWVSGGTQYTTTGAAFTSAVGPGVAIDGITFKDVAARTVTVGGSSTLTLNSGVIVNSAVAANTSAITGGTIQGSPFGNLNILNNDTSANLTISSSITNNGGTTGLAKYGAGLVIINKDVNSFTGPVTIDAGELQSLTNTTVGAKSPLGTGTITANTGTTLRFKTGSTSNAQSYVNAINLNGATFYNDDGVITISGPLTTTGSSTVSGVWSAKNATFSGLTTVSSGTLSVTGAATDSFSSVAMASGTQLTIAAATNLGVLSGAGTIQHNSGTLTITGDNTGLAYAGAISLGSAGGSSFIVNSGAKLITTGSFTENFGRTNTINGTLTTGAMTITDNTTTVLGGTGVVNVSGFTNANFSTTSITVPSFNVGSGGITVSNGSLALGATTVGALAPWSSAGTLGLTALTTTTFDTTGGNITLSGRVGAGTTGALTKTGPGVLTLSGTNNYTGLTTVSAGTLRLSGVNASAITVNSGAVLSGSNTGSTTGLLTLNGGSILAVDTTGAFTANGVTFAGAATATFTSAPVSGTTYDVLAYGAGAVTGYPANFTVAARGTLAQDTTLNKFTFTAGGVGTRTWNTTTGAWDNMTTANFVEGDQLFSSGDTVVFNDPASASTVTLSGVISPASVSVSNTSNYTFAGPGYLNGTASLTKAGAGTLTLGSANNFSGTIGITGGTLEVGGAGVLGAGAYSGTIANAGTLKINSTSNQILSGAIGGAGSLVKDNTGTLSLSVQSNFTGNTTVSGGVLKLTGGGGSSGTIRGGITVNPGATLDLATGDATGYSGGASALTSINLAGGTLNVSTTSNQTLGTSTIYMTGASITGVPSSNMDFLASSALNTLASSTTSTIGGVTLDLRQTSGVTFNVAGGTTPSGIDLLVASTITNNAYGANPLIKAGTGTMRLTGTNNYTGATTISAGKFELGGAGLLGNGAYAGAISDGGILAVNSSANQTLSGLISGAGTLIKDNSGTLTLSNTNTFSGNVTVSAGILKFGVSASGSNGALGALSTAPSKVTVASGGAVDFNGMIDSTYGYTIAGSGPTGLGALINTGGTISTAKKQASNITLSNDATIGGTGDWGLLTLSYGLTTLDLAGKTLTKTGPNTIYLVNSAMTAGTINIAGGTLQATQAGSVGSSTAVTMNNTAGSSLLVSANLTIGALSGGGSTGGSVTLSSSTLTVGGLNTSTTYAGIIAGSAALTKTGTGTLTLTGAGTFSGTTTVSNGTLEVTAKATNDTTYSVAQGATLKYGYTTVNSSGYSPSLTINGNGVSDAAGLYILGGKTLGANSGILLQTAPTTIRSYGSGNATIRGFDVNSPYVFLKTASTASGSVVDSTINVSTGSYGYRLQTDPGANTATGDLTILGVISGSSSVAIGGEAIATGLHKFGTGSLLLKGSNTYLSGTSINAGQIIVAGGDNRLPTGTTVALGNGSTSAQLILGDASGPSNQQLAGLITNGSGTSNAVVGGSSSVSTLTYNGAAGATLAVPVGGTGTNQNNIALTKIGGASLTINRSNTYSGNTNITAGTLEVTNTTGSATGSGTVVVTGATLTGTGFISGPVVLNGSAVASSAGMLTISNTLSASGASNSVPVGSTISTTGISVAVSGSLTINGTILGGGTSTIAGTVSGSGSISSNLDITGGTISPGNSPGILSVSGDVTMDSASSLVIDIGGLTEGTDYDQVKVDGSGQTVTLDGTLNILQYGGYVPTTGDVFFIVRNGSTNALSGTFAGLSNGAVAGTIAGQTLLIYYNADYDTTDATHGTGNDVALVVVPEPSMLAVAGVGAMGLLRRRRRSR